MVATDVKNEADYTTAIAKRRIVETGKTSDNKVEIISGLQLGDTIIVEGARSVKEDQQLRIKA
jgi:multidrug efflux pump subunit AcrA (membrane-fusion protein)